MPLTTMKASTASERAPTVMRISTKLGKYIKVLYISGEGPIW